MTGHSFDLTPYLLKFSIFRFCSVTLKTASEAHFRHFDIDQSLPGNTLFAVYFRYEWQLWLKSKSSKRSLIVFVRFPHVISSNQISNLQIEEDQSVNFINIEFQWSWYGKILKDFQRPLICTCFNWSKFETWVFSQLNGSSNKHMRITIFLLKHIETLECPK